MSSRKLYQLEHSTYICKYHLVWVTRYRGKVMADKFIKAELMSQAPSQGTVWCQAPEWHLSRQNYVKHQEHHQIDVPKLPLWGR